MKITQHLSSRYLYCLVILLLFTYTTALAQTRIHNVCPEGDCAEEILDIKITVPVSLTTASAERLEQYKSAYLQEKQLEANMTRDAATQEKYQSGLASGKSCLKQYYLQALFAYEYDQNPEFKKFIDQQEQDTDAFQLKGFKASKHTQSMLNRMSDQCKNKVKSLAEEGMVTQDHANTVYRRLAEVQGYFEALRKAKEQLAKALSLSPDKAAELQNVLAGLSKETELKGAVDNLLSNQQNAKSKLEAVTGILDKLAPKSDNMLSKGMKLLSEVANLGAQQGIVDQLISTFIPGSKYVLIAKDLLLGQTNLQEQVEKLLPFLKGVKDKIFGFKKKAKQLEDQANLQNDETKKLKDELLGLLNDKADLQSKLENPTAEVEQLVDKVSKGYKDYLAKFKKQATDTQSLDEQATDLKQQVEALQNQLEATQNQLETYEKEQEQLQTKTDDLQHEVEEVVEDDEKNKEVILKQEETALREEFGTDIELKPVPVEEWAENFEVERTYWKAEFHPDDEVVEGYVGRYFVIQLKDASESVKLLFGPGEYFMDKRTFREKYGATVGSFVRETLHHLKKKEEGKVKVFIQGSADNAGSSTFSGQLDDNFFYDKIDVLPQKDDPERFRGQETEKTIPTSNFRNNHLPDLRAQFLKQMIAIYSKKIDPILLEGVVRDFQAEEERNATIYLFFPDEILGQ